LGVGKKKKREGYEQKKVGGRVRGTNSEGDTGANQERKEFSRAIFWKSRPGPGRKRKKNRDPGEKKGKTYLTGIG